MTDITELALIKGQKVEAPYYLAECTECGKMYSSSKLIVSRNYFDGDADCYCPHCNADDADIADLGSSEQPAAMAWNYQQARIDALVEALESEKRICSTWRKTAESTSEKLEKAQQRISQLESRTVTVKLPDFRHEHFNSDWGEHDAEAYQVALREALTASGIKVEAK
ncbi:phage EaA protein [Klebsiella pneumoniae]|nr:phage EaA protein [Klebsiella pneumoniae]